MAGNTHSESDSSSVYDLPPEQFIAWYSAAVGGHKPSAEIAAQASTNYNGLRASNTQVNTTPPFWQTTHAGTINSNFLNSAASRVGPQRFSTTPFDASAFGAIPTDGYYSITNGKLFLKVDGKVVAFDCVSGKGEYQNNINATGVKNAGPIPAGKYVLRKEEGRDYHRHECYRLYSVDGQGNLHDATPEGRDGLLLHTAWWNGTIGCIGICNGQIDTTIATLDHMRDVKKTENPGADSVVRQPMKARPTDITITVGS